MRIVTSHNYQVLRQELSEACKKAQRDYGLDLCEIRRGRLHTGTRQRGRPLRVSNNHRRQYEPEHRRSGYIDMRSSNKSAIARAFADIFVVLFDRVFYGDDVTLSGNEKTYIWITISGRDKWSVRPWQRDESHELFGHERRVYKNSGASSHKFKFITCKNDVFYDLSSNRTFTDFE